MLRDVIREKNICGKCLPQFWRAEKPQKTHQALVDAEEKSGDHHQVCVNPIAMVEQTTYQLVHVFLHQQRPFLLVVWSSDPELMKSTNLYPKRPKKKANPPIIERSVLFLHAKCILSLAVGAETNLAQLARGAHRSGGRDSCCGPFHGASVGPSTWSFFHPIHRVQNVTLHEGKQLIRIFFIDAIWPTHKLEESASIIAMAWENVSNIRCNAVKLKAAPSPSPFLHH